MPLLPVGDGGVLAPVPSIDSHVLHVWHVLEELHHAQREVLVERVLGNDVHEERHPSRDTLNSVSSFASCGHPTAFTSSFRSSTIFGIKTDESPSRRKPHET